MRSFIIILLFSASANLLAQNAEQKISELGIELFKPAAPIANYVKALRVGNLIFLAGHGPTKADGTNITGKVGKELSIEQGYAAARQTAISMLSTLKMELGDLNKVKRVVKVLGMVNCHSDFKDHPKVINGFSDLIVSVFGESGKHARSAVGVNSLPMNIAVEVEMIVEITE